MMTPVHANDLDDGIAIDEPIKDDLQTDLNIGFIQRRAKAKVNIRKKTNQQVGCGTGNIVVQAGAKVNEVINLSTSKGNSIVCTN